MDKPDTSWGVDGDIFEALSGVLPDGPCLGRAGDILDYIAVAFDELIVLQMEDTVGRTLKLLLAHLPAKLVPLCSETFLHSPHDEVVPLLGILTDVQVIVHFIPSNCILADVPLRN